MKFINDLIVKHNLDERYSDNWTSGGTSGTCWDESGPNPCEIDITLDEYTFTPYVKLVDEFGDGEYSKYKSCLETWENGESDYHGGYRETTYIAFETATLLRMFLWNKHNIPVNTSINDVKKIIPEYFL